MKYLITLSLFCFITLSHAQSLKGLVVSKKDTTIVVQDALITIGNTSKKEHTNEKGEFHFKDKLPVGKHEVIVRHKKYETQMFVIHVMEGQNMVINNIQLKYNKKEKKRLKELKRQRQLDEYLLAKEKLAKERRAKQSFNLRKNDANQNILVKYDSIPPAPAPKEEPPKVVEKEETISPLQKKYGARLGKPAEEITNTELYTFIDQWLNTPYLNGGETVDGIDCSSFSQLLYAKVYDLYIERTAKKQFDSNYTDKFQGKGFLQEGDLLFFRGSGKQSNTIGHVGVYLDNNKFVHATARRENNIRGVMISDLSDAFWTKIFVAGGRRIIKK